MEHVKIVEMESEAGRTGSRSGKRRRSIFSKRSGQGGRHRRERRRSGRGRGASSRGVRRKSIGMRVIDKVNRKRVAWWANGMRTQQTLGKS